MKKNRLFFLLLLISPSLFGQSPSNNEPTFATPLTVVPMGGSPMIINGTTANSSTTTTPSNPTVPSNYGCTNFVTSNPNDVWYKINSSSFSNFQISLNSATYFGAPGYLRIYQDISASGMPMTSFCSPTANNALGTVMATGFSTNTDYYLAVSPTVGTNGFWGAFSINIFGSSAALGVNSLLDFNVRKHFENNNELQWSISSDAEVKEFHIQRKDSEQNEFKVIQIIANETGETQFNYNDFDFKKGNISTYRIVSVSQNNEWTYSKSITAISSIQNDKIVCYPNPSYNNFTINRAEVDTDGLIEVFDITGKKIFKSNIESGIDKIQVPSETWTNGIYYIKYTNSNDKNSTQLSWVKK